MIWRQVKRCCGKEVTERRGREGGGRRRGGVSKKEIVGEGKIYPYMRRKFKDEREYWRGERSKLRKMKGI